MKLFGLGVVAGVLITLVTPAARAQNATALPAAFTKGRIVGQSGGRPNVRILENSGEWIMAEDLTVVEKEGSREWQSKPETTRWIHTATGLEWTDRTNALK